jgi:hypothetical protein
MPSVIRDVSADVVDGDVSENPPGKLKLENLAW